MLRKVCRPYRNAKLSPPPKKLSSFKVLFYIFQFLHQSSWKKGRVFLGGEELGGMHSTSSSIAWGAGFGTSGGDSCGIQYYSYTVILPYSYTYDFTD